MEARCFFFFFGVCPCRTAVVLHPDLLYCTTNILSFIYGLWSLGLWLVQVRFWLWPVPSLFYLRTLLSLQQLQPGSIFIFSHPSALTSFLLLFLVPLLLWERVCRSRVFSLTMFSPHPGSRFVSSRTISSGHGENALCHAGNRHRWDTWQNLQNVNI